MDSDCSCGGGKCVSQVCQCSVKETKPSIFEMKNEKDNPRELGSDCSGIDSCDIVNSICIDGRECGCLAGRVGSANNLACNKGR